MHIDKRGGAVKTGQHPRPLFKGNISVADCMSLSTVFKTIEINGGGVYKKSRDSRRISCRSLMNAHV